MKNNRIIAAIISLFMAFSTGSALADDKASVQAFYDF